MPARPKTLVLLVSALFGLLGPASDGGWALDPDKAISQFNHRFWQDELPQNTVHSITQTRDGYLWLGTYEGLARFDGIRFVVFDSAHSHDLPATTVFDLNEDRAGRLWIATNGGLTWMEDGVFTTLGTDDGLPSAYVTVSREASDGSIWVGTDHGICRLVEDTAGPRCLPIEAPALTVRALAIGASGELWVATDSGLGRYEEGRPWRLLGVADGLPHELCRSVLLDRQGVLWVGTNGGLARYEDERWTTLTVADGLPDNLVRELLEDRDGNLWIGTEQSGLSRLHDDGRIETFGSVNGLSNDFVRSLYEDREGNLWVGTNGGVNQLRDGKLTTFGTAEGLTHEFVRAVYEDRENRLWVGTYGGGLDLYENGEWSALTTEDGLANNSVLAIHEGADGALWVGTRNGLSRYQDGTFRNFNTRNGLTNDIVRVLLEDREGTLWVGTEGGGLDRYRDGRWSSLTTEDGLGANDVRALHEDRAGRLWIGTLGGLNLFEYGVLTRFSTTDGLSNDLVFEIHEDSEGHLWIGTDVGLNLYRGGRFTAFTTEQGLFDNKIFRILEDDAGYFWMSSNRGISRVARADLLAVADGKLERVHAEGFTKADGMKANQCNGASQPAGWKTHDGRLWFPTVRGVVRVDPGNLRVNPLPPPVVLEELVAGPKELRPRYGLELDPGIRRLEFHYTALSFVAPDRVEFLYQLEGFDPEWVEAGNRRTAYYTNIPPGNYVFRVIAANNDGIWNREGAAVAFVVRTPLWARPWAILLYAATLLGLVWGGIRWRFSSLERQNRLLEARVAERTAELDEKRSALAEKVRQLQISERRAHESERRALEANRAKTVFLSNMSHELRTPLNSIIGFSSILGDRLEEELDPRHLRFLQNIRRSGEHLLGLINDLLDLSKIEAGRMEIQPERFVVAEALEEVRGLMRGVTEDQGVEILIEVAEGVGEVNSDPGKFRQVLLNLVSNAVKFSSPGSRVTLSAVIEDAEISPLGAPSLRVDVSDEGIGISEEDQEIIFEAFRQADGSASRVYQGTGLGLALIKRLLEIQGGAVSVESRVGEGSTFTCRLPLDPQPERAVARTPALRPPPPESRVPGDVRILVVEDDPAAFHAIAATLEAEGFAVDSARDGKEAILALEGGRPDLVTLDLVLPDFDGWEVLKEIKSRPGISHIPIVIVSVRESRELGLALGAADFFVKPVEPESFVRRVRELIEMPERGPVRILVIDDEPEVHELLEASFEPEGWETLSAYDGEAGVVAALAESPSLVVLDLMMPGMSGFDVADALESDPLTSSIPVVVLTAKDLTAAEREFLSGRIHALVEKGSDKHRRLSDLVRELLGVEAAPRSQA